MTRTQWWIAYAAHRLLILTATVFTALVVGLAVHDATTPRGDLTLAPAWAAPLLHPVLAAAAPFVATAATAAMWVCVVAIGRILSRSRARREAAPAAALPVPDFGRDVFVDDPDFAALARGTAT